MMIWDGIEKRRFVRVVHPYSLYISSPEGETISTYTEDISCGGVRALTRQELKIEDEVDLKIQIKEEFVKCKARVIWIREKPSSVLAGVVFYSVGMEFMTLSENDKLLITKCVSELERKHQ